MPEPQEAPPVRVMFARFPGGHVDRDDVTDWLVGAVLAAKADPRIQPDILNWRRTDTPITMVRNLCIEVAKSEQVDFLIMVDNDMKPDAYLPSNPYAMAHCPAAKPFFQSSFDFAYQQRLAGKPCVIGAPYCGPPPCENIYVFQWANWETGGPEDNADIKLEQFTREQAATMRGIQEVAALPTGLIILDMRCIAENEPPYFYYEWKDKTESEKASTEDVTFTRDTALHGCTQYCNWDAWAGHWKQKCVGRPMQLTARSISQRFRNRVLAQYNIQPGEELITVGNGKPTRQPGTCPPARANQPELQSGSL